ncbi:MAG: hypothetical protein H6617_09210 [Bdellovibrionaceae bacterium]|nr:hypothetical protein [Bdellovibrionales bacterium]MCB9254846.1 hypothetical protein [Pseudobdellovibrionaceae bacterium]
MKSMKLSFLFMVALLLANPSTAEDLHNEKLGDVMLLISDQIAALVDFQKKAPAEVTEKEFARALSRTRVSQWLFTTLDKSKGEIVEGAFAPAELTPGKIPAAAAEDQEALLKEYADYLASASAAFAGIQTELNAQLALPVEERDFAVLKKANTAVFLVMGKAHKIFKP